MQVMPRDQTVRMATPNAVVAPAPAPNQLTSEQLAALRDATERARKIRRAAGVATFNTWAIGFFAVPGVLFGLFDFPTFVMAVAFSLVAYHEHRGGRGLRRFEPAAARLLGWNQVALATVLVLYGLWGIWHTLGGPSAYDEEIMRMPQLAPTLEPLGKLYKTIALLTYATVIGGSMLFQGLNAWYYFSRARHIRDYLCRTPRWVVELQRATAAG